MRAILTGVVATIEAVAVALASLLAVAAYAFLVWWLGFGLAAEPSAVFGGAGAAWLLAHFVPLTAEISAEAMQVLGFAPEALTFSVSLAPLGLTLATVVFAARAGWRFGARGGAGGVGVLGGALGFGAVAAVVASAVAPGGEVAVGLGWAAAAGCAAIVYGTPSGVAYLTRAARDEHPWWIAAVSGIEAGLGRLRIPRPAVVPRVAGQALRLASALVAAYIGIAALGFTFSLLGRFALVIGASEALQLDLAGTILMFLLQLALLPVFVIWSGAWLTGSGFAVGIGSSASPFGQLLGPMPGIPVLAAIPDGWGSVAVLAPLLLVLLGLAVGIGLGDVARRQSMARLGAQIAGAVIVAGLTIALLNWTATGALGPGRLADVGPDVWRAAGLAAAELGVGCLLGALAARADIARRVVAGPGEVAARLGLGDDGAAADPDRGIALGGEPDPATVRQAPARTASEEDPVEDEQRLAPVSPLVPHARASAGSRVDDQLTEPLEFDVDVDGDTDILPDLKGTPGMPGDSAWAPASDRAWGHTRDADPAGVDSADADPGSVDVPQPDAELFDQHAATGPVEAVTAHPAKEATASEAVDAQIDEEALVEAYSWDNVDLDADRGGDEKRAGWRWPGRKG
ncbi:cell division protein PerM [Leucobacter aridicollis]|uniref:cell division protein PerM n=1 Tax=Leucobacter aridicollis TaxID=283878 RepID=UPI002102E63B|nr:DUF6350 family protein [Leucobacter aridicollis]UTX54141.1 hypothetical protein KI794_05370 [Leucobacter aridicollis]